MPYSRPVSVGTSLPELPQTFWQCLPNYIFIGTGLLKVFPFGGPDDLAESHTFHPEKAERTVSDAAEPAIDTQALPDLAYL